MDRPIKPAIDRFLAKVEPVTESGCWIWTGSAVREYGNFPVYVAPCVPMKIVYAHRWSYEHFVGPIPEGLDVLHRCDVPSCVNPAHLFPGTHKENMEDRERKGRGVSLPGELSGKNVLTDDLVRHIRGSKEPIRKVAARLGVSFHCVRAAKVRLTWKHIE